MKTPEALRSFCWVKDSLGVVIDAPLPETGPWQLAGIVDDDLAKAAYHLEHGTLIQIGRPGQNRNLRCQSLAWAVLRPAALCTGTSRKRPSAENGEGRLT